MIIRAGQRVLIWGFGRHGGGQAAARFCAAQGALVTILDLKPAAAFAAEGAAAMAAGWQWVIGDASHPAFVAADVVVASPAIPPRAWPAQHPPRCSPEALFFAAHHGPRIAITGTKGKSTTAHILATLLGWQVAGNSYVPLLELLASHGPEVPVVCELSSFQLWYLAEFRPAFDGVILTSLAVDHLDWHPDLADYRRCKLHLLEWTPVVVIAPEIEISESETPATGINLSPVTVRDGHFISPAGTVLAERADLPLLGEHNVRNTALALALALHLGMPATVAATRLRAIRGLPHRLEFVPGSDHLTYCNDSIATTPEATMAALAAVSGPLAVILGGSDKGADYQQLAQAVVARGATAILIGATAERLAACVRAAGGNPVIARELSVAVPSARQALTGGGTVLLSPACASFDQFQGFEDRGAQFRLFARGLFPT